MSGAAIREAMQSSKTLVFGHRGAMASAPMNTMPSFQLAYAQGADGIELDVHLSSDGHIVVLHDFTVNATTDGAGAVSELTLSQLKQLDAGSWYSEGFAGECIPTLDEVFLALGDKLFFNVEIKSQFAECDAIAEQVADCIRRHRMSERTIVSSFDPWLLKRFREVCQEVMIGFLHSPSDTAALMDGLAPDAQHPWHDAVDKAYMDWAKFNGYLVNVWTVNEPERACLLARLGVNGIISDSPACIISALSQC